MGLWWGDTVERWQRMGGHGGDMAEGGGMLMLQRGGTRWEGGHRAVGPRGETVGGDHTAELWHGGTRVGGPPVGLGGGATVTIPPCPFSPAGYTPLHIAVLRKDLEMVELLLSAGADLNKAVSATVGRGGTWGWGYKGPPRPLTPPMSPPQEPSCGRSPLHLAVEAQSPEVAEALLRAGADPAARMYVGYTPLYSARHRPNPRLPQLLRDFGAQDPPADEEDTPDEDEGDNSDVSYPSPTQRAPRNPLSPVFVPMGGLAPLPKLRGGLSLLPAAPRNGGGSTPHSCSPPQN